MLLSVHFFRVFLLSCCHFSILREILVTFRGSHTSLTNGCRVCCHCLMLKKETLFVEQWIGGLCVPSAEVAVIDRWPGQKSFTSSQEWVMPSLKLLAHSVSPFSACCSRVQSIRQDCRWLGTCRNLHSSVMMWDMKYTVGSDKIVSLISLLVFCFFLNFRCLGWYCSQVKSTVYPISCCYSFIKSLLSVVFLISRFYSYMSVFADL